MSEMVERVARAMLDSEPTWTGEHWDDDRRLTVREFLESTHLQDAIEVIARDAARAAIEAMRQPNEQQIAAAWDVITAEKQGHGITRLMPGLGAREIYQAMVSAALGDGE